MRRKAALCTGRCDADRYTPRLFSHRAEPQTKSPGRVTGAETGEKSEKGD